MADKEKLVPVRFWIGKDLKKEIDDFAHGLNLASSDFYKGGAVLLKKIFESPKDIVLNLFTRSFKDLENKEIQKKILKSYRTSSNIY